MIKMSCWPLSTRDTGTKDDSYFSKPPQLPPVVLQKIASMLDDDGVFLQLRNRIRFASVSRQMNAAVRGGIDGMERRRMKIRVHHPYDAFNVSNLKVKNRSRCGYTPTECIDALMAFGRPSNIYIDFGFPHHHKALRPSMVVIERTLAAIPPSSILRFDLGVKAVEFGLEQSPFYGMMTCIGKMVNLETLTIRCFFDCNHASAADEHKNSLPSVPSGSPFLQLLKLEKLTTYELWAKPLMTAAQEADLINRSPSNISHLCYQVEHLNDLMPSLDARVCANITKVCQVPFRRQLSDLLPSLLERLPHCTDVSVCALNRGAVPDRPMIDEIGGELVETVIAVGHNDKLTLHISVSPDALDSYRNTGGQTQFTYERMSTVIKVLLVPCEIFHCPFI